MSDPQCVLIVDDKEDNLYTLALTLSPLNLLVLKARNGAEALLHLSRHHVSLALIDVQMPEMDGFDLARIMRSNERTTHIPIIFLTAIIIDEQQILEGYHCGAIDYLVKPFDPDILTHKVKLQLDLDTMKKALIHERKASESQRAYFESILTAAGDGILGVDIYGMIQFSNPAALQMLQYTRDELTGKNISDILTGDATQFLRFESTPFYESYEKNKFIKFSELLFYRKDKSSFPVSVVSSPFAGSEHQGISIVFSDMSFRKMLEEKLIQQSRTDALTGLSNRTVFVNNLTQSIARAKRLGKMIAVLFVDLDQFKQINDIMGHDAGDHLIHLVSQRIVHDVRLNDTVARFSGDEFVVLIEDIHVHEHAARVAEKILESLKKPFVLSNQEISVTASIGISLFPECGEDASSLMRTADIAMCRVKAAGRNGYQYFSPGMSKDAKTKLHLEQELRQALDHNQLEMYFQPILRIGTHELVGIEALVRWHRSPGEMISPHAFIPILEETGLIVPFGRWILWMSCLQTSHWVKSKMLPPTIHVCVNISGRQFSSVGFYEMLVDIIHQTGINPHMLELEITESFFISDSDRVRTLLSKIKALGVHLSIDDFGTGYSSLSYLKRYPVDVIKIDRSFIIDLSTSAKDRALVKAIIDVAHALGFSVLVEGVETATQLTLLEKMGVDTFQGYITTMPLPVDKFEAWVQEKYLPSPN